MINVFPQAAYRKSKENDEKARAAKANGAKKPEVRFGLKVWMDKSDNTEM